MQEMITQFKFVVGALLLLLVLEIVPVFFAPHFEQWQENREESEAQVVTPKLSDFEGVASIGGPAVMVSQEDGMIENIMLCSGIPESGFILLFLLFILLLAFNLRASYQAKGYVGGVFEIILTVAFLGLWAYFDECRTASWFLLLTVKTGLILYVLAVIALPYSHTEEKPQDATLF